MNPDEIPGWLDDPVPVQELQDGPPRNLPDHLAMGVLDMVHNGRAVYPRKSKRNVALILELDRRWKGQICLNLFDGQIYIRGQAIEDTAETEAAIWLDRVYGIDIATTSVSEVMRLIATRNAWHPVRDYLRSVEWDGTERCKRLLADYFSAEDSELNSVLSRCFLVSCVARVMEPGCKVDTTLILKGKQGVGKSTGLRALASARWFSDTPIEVGNKDGYGGLNGVWIYEFSELDSMSRKEATAVKGFLSAQVDRYRPPYGRNFVTRPRQTVTTGTTNEDAFLKDSTGSRRFWPVEVGQPGVESLEADRDQLWAEALSLYEGGWTWWLWDSQATELADVSRAFESVDVWEPALLEWAQGREGFTMAEMLEGALDIKAGRATPREGNRAGVVMKRAGWSNRRVRGHKARAMCWYRD